MILIGSRALNEYIPLNRVMHDWDFIMSKEEHNIFHDKWKKYHVKTTEYSIIYDIENEIVEVRNPDFLDETDVWLKDGIYNSPYALITKFGVPNLPSLSILYKIKKATLEVIKEEKHKYDLELIDKYYDSYNFIYDLKNLDDVFLQKRLAEIKARQEKSKKVKYDFFHKYKNLPEYIEHDSLHLLIADLLDINIPTYQRITSEDVKIEKDLFDKLTYDQKVSLMTEEVLVLNLERWFLPRMIEDGINFKLIDLFYNSNEANPTYKILKHVCVKGLKTEKDYIVNFGKENFFIIEKSWLEAKKKIKEKGGFPQSFYNQLFELRNKYKNGEKVAVI